jgi:hypothetical protein
LAAYDSYYNWHVRKGERCHWNWSSLFTPPCPAAAFRSRSGLLTSRCACSCLRLAAAAVRARFDHGRGKQQRLKITSKDDSVARLGRRALFVSALHPYPAGRQRQVGLGRHAGRDEASFRHAVRVWLVLAGFRMFVPADSISGEHEVKRVQTRWVRDRQPDPSRILYSQLRQRLRTSMSRVRARRDHVVARVNAQHGPFFLRDSTLVGGLVITNSNKNDDGTAVPHQKGESDRSGI